MIRACRATKRVLGHLLSTLQVIRTAQSRIVCHINHFILYRKRLHGVSVVLGLYLEQIVAGRLVHGPESFCDRPEI